MNTKSSSDQSSGTRHGEEVLHRDYRMPHEEYLRAVQGYLESLDCPRALTVWLLYRENTPEAHKQLVELEFDPRKFDVLNFSNAYAATILFSKFDGLNVDIDTEAVAYEKLLRTEVECWKVNERFKNLSNDYPSYGSHVVWLHDATRRKIAEILGPVDIDVILDCADWGPGSTQLMKLSEGCAANKFQIENGTTKDLHRLLMDVSFFAHEGLSFSPLWSKLRKGLFSFSRGNMVGFVPKSSKTDRSIAIEPGLNIWFQKGIGGLIRRRLRNCGVNLNSQVRNQEEALRGSLTDTICTVDFSSASDSIARNLVEDLLPSSWFQLMESTRSQYGFYPGAAKAHRWEKFSSMGNGFTFELESLIFYAVALCCYEYIGREPDGLSVYGDDVTLHEDCLPLFSMVCKFMGFTLNPDKSFYRSDFRESCGEHYHRGVHVKPIYLKKVFKRLPDVIKFHNSIVRRSRSSLSGDSKYSLAWRDKRYKRVVEYLVSRVPKPLRFRISDGLGDGGFVSNLDEANPSRAAQPYTFKGSAINNGNLVKVRGASYPSCYTEGWKVQQLAERSIPFAFSGEGLVLASLWRLNKSLRLTAGSGRISFSFLSNYMPRLIKTWGAVKLPRSPKTTSHDVVARKGFTSLVIEKVIISQWVDLGPWQ